MNEQDWFGVDTKVEWQATTQTGRWLGKADQPCYKTFMLTLTGINTEYIIQA